MDKKIGNTPSATVKDTQTRQGAEPEKMEKKYDVKFRIPRLNDQKVIFENGTYRTTIINPKISSPEVYGIECGDKKLYIAYAFDMRVRKVKSEGKGRRKSVKVYGLGQGNDMPEKWIVIEKLDSEKSELMTTYREISYKVPKEIRDDIDEFAEYRERFASKLSVEAYTYALKKFYEIVGKIPSKLTVDDIEKFLNEYTKKVEKRTVAHRIIILRAYFEWKKRKDMVDFLNEEAKHYRRLEKNEPVFFTRKDIENIFAAARTIEKKEDEKITKADILKTKRDEAIISLLYHTGLRGAELGNLKRSDIRENGTGFIILVKKGKGKKDRRVPLFDEAREFLNEYLRMRKDDKEPLFLSKYERKLTIDSVEWIIKKIYEKAGIDKKYVGERLGCHSLRRACATHLYQDGMNIGRISKFLGHTNITTTQLYIGLTEEEMFADFYKHKKRVVKNDE